MCQRSLLILLLIDVLAVSLAFCSLQGCGYYLGHRASMGVPYSRVYVEKFYNASDEVGVEQWLYSSILERFQETNAMGITNDKNNANVVLYGRIKEVRVRAVAFNRLDNVAEYRVILVIEATLKNCDDNKVIWHDGFLTRFGDFLYNPNILEAEQNRSRAIQHVCKVVATDVYDKTIHPF